MSIFQRASVVNIKVMSAALGSDFTSASYTPPGGEATTCRVVVNESTEARPTVGDFFTVSEPTPEALFLKVEVDPVKDAVLVVGATTWKIVDRLDDDTHHVTVSLRPVA